MSSSEESLKNYILNTKNSLQDIISLSARKKKTNKWKTCNTTCKILLTRIEAIQKVIYTWGNGNDIAITGDEVVYKMLYDPFILYWTGELKK